jgi:ADP-ribose pyrophosphatase
MAASERDESGRDDHVPDEPEPFAGYAVLASQRIYHSLYCGLRRDTLALADGREQEYHVIEIPDAAVVVPVLADGSIVLIGQYRYPHGKTHWEVPAGRMLSGEPAEEAALREVREETGYKPGKLVKLPGFYAANGITAHYAHAFAALDCVKVGEQSLDPCEQISVHTFTRVDVEKLLDAGRFQDAFTAISLMYYLRRFPR